MTGKVNISELDCVDGHKIGIAELDNPASLNALTLDMLKQLKSSLEDWEKDDSIACVFLHAFWYRKELTWKCLYDVDNIIS